MFIIIIKKIIATLENILNHFCQNGHLHVSNQLNQNRLNQVFGLNDWYVLTETIFVQYMICLKNENIPLSNVHLQ